LLSCEQNPPGVGYSSSDGRARQLRANSIQLALPARPDNPFILMLIFDLVLLAALAIVYWVYATRCPVQPRAVGGAGRDLPGGWLLPALPPEPQEFDRIEAELFDEAEHDGRIKRLPPRVISSCSAKSARCGAMAARATALDQAVATAQLQAADTRAAAGASGARVEKRSARQRRVETRQQRAARARRGTSAPMTARRLPLQLTCRQRAFHGRLEVTEKLKTVAREDPALEELIYDMKYLEALKAAREALGIAEEMSDAQGIVTYRAYVERIERIMENLQ
jgi:hypothetical protein